MDKSVIIKRLERRSQPVPFSGCWIWTGASRFYQYGSMKVDGKNRSTHRLSWECFRGPIPEGMCVLHKCDIGSCINPDHLFLGTYKDNSRDRENKNRGNHPSGENHAAKRIAGWCQGSRNPQAKLSESDVLNIRKSEAKTKFLCLQYGVSRSTIKRIRNNKRWRHI